MKTLSSIMLALVAAIALHTSGCALSHKSSGEKEKQCAGIDCDVIIDAHIKDSEVLNDFDSGGTDRGSHTGIDAENAEVSSNGQIDHSGKGLEGVEVCLECSNIMGSEVFTALTDAQGKYFFENLSGYCSSNRTDTFYSLSARKFGYAFEPEEIPIQVTGSLSGLIEDDFVVTAIESEPYATGQWKLIEFDCPGRECLDSDDAGICLDLSFLCPEAEIGTIYTFTNGCLLNQANMNCVNGTEYTYGDSCTARSYGAGGNLSIGYGGSFHEDTERWYLSESHYFQGTSYNYNTSYSISARYVFERVETPNDN